MSDLLVIRANRSQKRAIRTKNKKNRIFCMFLTVFSFLCPRTNHSRHSSLSRSFFKEWHGIFDHVSLYKRATVRESLRSLITNERPWAICSRCSFAHKKRVIRSKNRWANSQPWVMGTQVCLSSLTVRVRESDSAHYTGGKRQYGLKGSCHEIFNTYYFHKSNPSEPLINRLKWSFLKIRFRKDIQI